MSHNHCFTTLADSCGNRAFGLPDRVGLLSRSGRRTAVAAPKHASVRLNRMLLPLLAAAFIAANAQIAEAGSLLSQTGQIRGIVIDWDTGRPIVGARVTIDAGAAVSGIDTDGSGRFWLIGVTVGSHILVVSKAGYFTDERTARVCPDASTTISIRSLPTRSTLGIDPVGPSPESIQGTQDLTLLTVSSPGTISVSPCP
jgi:hypothetical protein